jgi:hypothetical protein
VAGAAPANRKCPEVVCAGEESKRVHSPHSSTMTDDLTRILSIGAESRPGYRSTDLKVMSTTPNHTSSNLGLAKQLSIGRIPPMGRVAYRLTAPLTRPIGEMRPIDNCLASPRLLDVWLGVVLMTLRSVDL